MSKIKYSFDSKGFMMLRRSTIFTSVIIIFVSNFLCGSDPQPSAPKTSWLQSMQKDNPLFVEGIVGGGAVGFAASRMFPNINPVLSSTLGAVGGVVWLNRRWIAQEHACYQRIRNEEYRRGHVAGHAFGKAIGRAEGNLEGFASGKEVGEKEGRKEGYNRAIWHLCDYIGSRLNDNYPLHKGVMNCLGAGEEKEVRNAWNDLLDHVEPLNDKNTVKNVGAIRKRLKRFIKEKEEQLAHASK
jgi:hypothetical protein